MKDEKKYEKKYVNMALLIVTTMIIVITSVTATYLVYNFLWNSAQNREVSNETSIIDYEMNTMNS